MANRKNMNVSYQSGDILSYKVPLFTDFSNVSLEGFEVRVIAIYHSFV